VLALDEDAAGSKLPRMKRLFGALILAAGVCVTVGACDSSSGSDHGYGYEYGYGYGGGSTCAAYTTCDTCTPVNGCGWCFTIVGGACASSPDECSSDSGEFTWTWNQSGCPDDDASVVRSGAQDSSAPGKAGH
jgi:hypothetical protein